ncbi:MAG: SpoIID/LytB domain-containing protein, partial [Deltaproteobacteria bacterium]|nr:SpoIID/LytB domain-containing protein [Deltaproteobacteria bacterium]
ILTADRNGKLAVVNAVDAETLLKGLVPSEIFNDAPMEALKAQAVTARGELFAKLGTRHTADPYMVCADVHCQVYRGSSRENPRTSRAVDATRGQMMFYKGRLVDSVYGASCGGHTESGSMVWQGSGHPYLTGVSDAPGGADVFGKDGVTEESVRRFIDHPPKGLYCGSTRYGRESFRWTKDVSFDDVRKGALKFSGRDVGPVTGLVTLQRGVSGRITRLEVRGEQGKAVLSPELIIRKAFGSLRSSLFVWDVVAGPSGKVFRFRGAGFGHGVGMCQYGAIGRAARGRKFTDILKHYYTGADVVRIY